MPRLLARQSDPTSSYAQPTLFPLIPALPKGHLRRLRLCALPKGRLRPPRRTPAASSAVKASLKDSSSGRHSKAPPNKPDLGGSQKCLRLDLDFAQLRGRNAFGKVEHLVAAATYLRPPRRTPVQCKCLLPCIFGSFPGALGAVPLSAG